MKKPAILGGTFDPLHDGHKALFDSAFELSDYVLIGLTSDSLAKSQRRRKITKFSVRKSRLSQYLYRAFPEKKFKIEEMDKIFNIPIIKDIKEGYLISSEGKVPVAERINKNRKKNKMKLLNIISVPYVLAEDGLPIKATRIREGEIDKKGRLQKKPVIAVGSTNKIKIEAVRFAFKKVFGDCIVKGFRIDSGVPHQPKDGETIKGAFNRAKSAFEKYSRQKDVTFGVGLEAGLFWEPKLKKYMDVQYCVIIDKGGSNTYGHSPGFYYPRSFDELIRKGEEIEDIVEKLYKIKKIGEKNGAVGLLTNNIVTRTDLLNNAVLMALVPRIRRDFYRD